MNMKIASLLIAAQVAGAQLHSAPRRQLRRDANAAKPNANQGADGADYFRHLEELSSMSMSQASTMDAASAEVASKPRSSKSSKNPDPLELRFGPQLSPEKVAKKFDKLTGSSITTYGLQNFAAPDFSTPIIDTFSTLRQLAISYDEVQSVCVTQCYNNPACKAVGVFECVDCEEGEETKPGYQCHFINPDLGPGAYIAKERAISKTGVVYVKKAGNTVIPSHDEVACNISASTLPADIFGYYVGCLPDAILSCTTTCANTCVGDGGEIQECIDSCKPGCYIEGSTQCADDLGLTNDFVNYILPGTDCLADYGGGVLFGCLTCLTSGRVGTAGICTANNDTNFVRGPCRDECYEVPLNDGTNNTLDISNCEPDVQVAMLCYNGSPEVGGVNRNNNTTPFACPE